MKSKGIFILFIVFLFSLIIFTTSCDNSKENDNPPNDSSQDSNHSKLIGLWKQIDEAGNDKVIDEPDVDFDVDGENEMTGVWNYHKFTETTISTYRKIVKIYYNGGTDTTSLQIGNVYIEEDDMNMGPYTFTGTAIIIGSEQVLLTFDGEIMLISEENPPSYDRFKKVDDSEVNGAITIPDDDD